MMVVATDILWDNSQQPYLCLSLVPLEHGHGVL